MCVCVFFCIKPTQFLQWSQVRLQVLLSLFCFYISVLFHFNLLCFFFFLFWSYSASLADDKYSFFVRFILFILLTLVTAIVTKRTVMIPVLIKVVLKLCVCLCTLMSFSFVSINIWVGSQMRKCTNVTMRHGKQKHQKASSVNYVITEALNYWSTLIDWGLCVLRDRVI